MVFPSKLEAFKGGVEWQSGNPCALDQASINEAPVLFGINEGEQVQRLTVYNPVTTRLLTFPLGSGALCPAAWVL